ncbi:hypothetical protein BD769DRAFT_1418989, partial [Suillus cothurnatus]
MCYRQLRFAKNTACGHLTFQGDTYIDCLARDCILSASHPTTCGSPGRPCNCRRYYSQPQRLITLEVYPIPQFKFGLVLMRHLNRNREHVHSAPHHDRVQLTIGRLTSVCTYIYHILVHLM